MENTIYPDIPAEKFEFAKTRDITHDKKLDTKPIGYFKGAFMRFCKNKGAIVAAIIIALLILFAIVAPFCTPYNVEYNDILYAHARPRSTLFENTNFWDGCEASSNGKQTMRVFYAIGEESGHNAIKNQEFTIDKTGTYHYRLDSIHKVGCVYQNFTFDEFAALQRYQDENNVQIIYPTLDPDDRPVNGQDKKNANYYFKTKDVYGKTQIVYESDGFTIIPVYAHYKIGTNDDKYTSKMRIEGEDGFEFEGERHYYKYSLPAGSGIEARINYYEYYKYYHTQVAKDGITEPYFVFGCDPAGKDILTCLSSGARFSFIFAIVVAISNFIVGAIYGMIEGYYGGKLDLIMERISDILAAVPMMIVISLLKYHMQGSSHILVLFLAFFLTGWIGTAGLMRMQFYRFKNQEYVLAARTLGASDKRIMLKHIFPNAIGTVVTSFALVIPSMIYSEVSLSYLGIINLSTGNITSVGTLIEAGQKALTTAPHVALFPTVFLVLLMLSFNLFGNGLRDAFNPSLRGSE